MNLVTYEQGENDNWNTQCNIHYDFFFTLVRIKYTTTVSNEQGNVLVLLLSIEITVFVCCICTQHILSDCNR